MKRIFDMLLSPVTLLSDFIGTLASESRRSSLFSYVLIRKLFVLTRGRSDKLFTWIFRQVRPPRAEVEDRAVSFLGADNAERLKRDGVTRIEGFFEENKVMELRDWLVSQPGYPVLQRSQRENSVLIRDNPILIAEMKESTKFYYDSKNLLNNPMILGLVSDQRILDIAEWQLKGQPIFTGINAWWLKKFDSNSSILEEVNYATTAQQYHYDHDYVKFIKLFLYLTDVPTSNGPFTYVKGSHVTKHSYRDGRYSDQEIQDIYDESIMECVGRAGDLVIADTKGFHKGGIVKEGDGRLLIQIEFAVSRLGGSFQVPLYPKNLRPQASGQTYAIFNQA